MATLNAWKRHLCTPFDASTIKVMLLTGTHVTNVDTQTFVSDVNVNEAATGTGYPAGGYTLAGFTITRDDANDRIIFDANDYVANNVTTTFRYYAFYVDTGVATTSRLINIVDNNTAADVVLTDDNLTIPIPATGFWRLA